MKQVTLVMLYGAKPFKLSTFITACQKKILELLGSKFQPYDIEQVHATLISLASTSGSTRFNLNFKKNRNLFVEMDFFGLLNFLRFEGKLPFQVQIGGFQINDYSFVSQGLKPYDRSFSVTGSCPAISLIVGWPICGKPIRNVLNSSSLDNSFYPSTLHEIRTSLQKFNVLHQYYVNATDVDNDFYFRIGIIQDPIENLLRKQVEFEIRHFMSRLEPLIVEIRLSDVYLACYDNDTLPLNSTRIWSIGDNEINPGFIKNLYEKMSS